MFTVGIPTPHGLFRATFSECGLAHLDFPESADDPQSEGTRESVLFPARVRQWQKATASALKKVLAGRAPDALPPLDWSRGTDFQRRVWAALLEIGPGQTMTYSEVAAAIGRPRATRAVGSACGANPIPVLVPCHRVLAAGGRLGGFSAGLNWKRRLLAGEGVIAAELPS